MPRDLTLIRHRNFADRATQFEVPLKRDGCKGPSKGEKGRVHTSSVSITVAGSGCTETGATSEGWVSRSGSRRPRLHRAPLPCYG